MDLEVGWDETGFRYQFPGWWACDRQAGHSFLDGHVSVFLLTVPTIPRGAMQIAYRPTPAPSPAAISTPMATPRSTATAAGCTTSPGSWPDARGFLDEPQDTQHRALSDVCPQQMQHVAHVTVEADVLGDYDRRLTAGSERAMIGLHTGFPGAILEHTCAHNDI